MELSRQSIVIKRGSKKRVAAVCESYGEDLVEDKGFGGGGWGFPLSEGKKAFQVRELDEQKGQCEPDGGGRPLLPASLKDAVPGCHGDDRLLWAGSLVEPPEQKRRSIPWFPFLSRLWNGSKCQFVFLQKKWVLFISSKENVIHQK